jgi:hypothetical protein
VRGVCRCEGPAETEPRAQEGRLLRARPAGAAAHLTGVLGSPGVAMVIEVCLLRASS